MPVTVHEYTAPEEFLGRAGALLERDPVRNGLMLSILQTLRTQPERYYAFHLWLAEGDGEPVGAATITLPFNLLLTEQGDPAAIRAIAEAVSARGVRPSGVNAAEPVATAFADEWRRLTGTTARTRMRLRLHRLERVAPLPEPVGAMRECRPGDRPLLLRWWVGFAAEAGPAEQPGEAQRSVDGRMAEPLGVVVWELDGRAVSMAGAAPSPGSALSTPHPSCAAAAMRRRWWRS
ncbi:MAG TPA: hypothetical protein VMU66_02295 [Gaiellales bacterium]|nr:hypothetical protein [Gaiellales bacterium]